MKMNELVNSDFQLAIKGRGWQVPSFTVASFKPKQSRYVTVVPVINEGVRIQNQLRKMAALDMKTDMVVVDGGSSDGSLEHEFLKSVQIRCLLEKTGPGKLSAQLRCAYAWALIEGYEGIITIDGNDKDGVETLPNFIKALDEGYDYVQASRFRAGGQAVNTPLSRLLAIRLIHAPLLSLGARVWLTDTTQGYRAYSSAYLLDDRTKPFRDIFVGYELLAYLTVRASQLGYRVTELPTSRIYPAGEEVPTKISGFKAMAKLISILFKTLAGHYHP